MALLLAKITRTRRAGVSCDTHSATFSACSAVLVKRHRGFGTLAVISDMALLLAKVTRTRRAGVSCDTHSATFSACSAVLVKRHRGFGTHDFKERCRKD